MRVFVIVSMMIPALYIILGIAELIWPPEKGTKVFGYRTARSQINQETWDYANHSFGIVCIFMGIYMAFATGVLDALAKYGTDHQRSIMLVIMVLIQAALVVFPIYHTEHQLKIYFDENGEVLFPEKIEFKDRKSADEWEDWNEWPEELKWEDWNTWNLPDDGWESWEEWLYKKDLEMDEKRKMNKTRIEKTEDQSAANTED